MKRPNLEERNLKILLYGAPGSKKTRIGASATFVPEMSPVLHLESAGNPLSIKDYDPLPYIITMESLKDYNAPYDFLAKNQPKDHPFAKALEEAGSPLPKEPFKTVFIDGITEVQRFAFKAVNPGVSVLPGDVPASIERQHFNRVLAAMVNWSFLFSKLDMNVILSSLESEKQDAAGNIYRRPLLWGQSEGEVSSYMYMVMRLTQTDNLDTRTKTVVATELDAVKNSSSIGFIRATSSFYAKEQYGMKDSKGELLRYMFDPDMSKIWNAVNPG